MRARNIKPAFFKNEFLAELDYEARLLFIGLWCLADREGRLEDRPKRIRAELFSYDECDVDSMLNQLQSEGFVVRYEVDGKKYLYINNFVKHQQPHYKEKESVIPPPENHENLIVATGVTRSMREKILERDDYTCQFCGSKTALCIDHITPVSKGGDSSEDNLQVLCMSCNTTKGNREHADEKKNTKPNKSGYVQKFGPNSIQCRIDNKLKETLVDPLIPDSLIPDSLIPDSLIPDSLKEEKSLCVKSDDVTHQYGDDVVEFVTQYQGYAVNHLGNRAPKVTTALIKNGCDTIDKLIRLDGHDLNQIRAVLRWAVQDEFWCDQIYSLASLRRAKDGLTKFQKILAACEKSCRQSITGGDVLRAMAQKGGCDGEQQGTDVYQAEIGGSGGYETAGYTNTNGNDQGAGPVVQNPDTEARRAALASW